jgi:hypothetical protein
VQKVTSKVPLKAGMVKNKRPKNWRALRPVFLTFWEPFPQAEYNMTRPGGLREAL